MARKKSTRARPARASQREYVEHQRQRLFQAHAVIEVTRHAIVSQLENLDEEAVTNALALAGVIVDDVAGALEITNKRHSPRDRDHAQESDSR